MLEIKALQRLDHPNIVRMYEFSLDRHQKKLFLILEALDGGDCKRLLKKPYKTLPESFVSKVVRQVMIAIVYCHSMGVVHRDIKLDNIMMTTSDWESCTAKLIDFGLSAMFDAGRAHVIHQVAGTVHFMAPEVISRKPFGDPADVWAVGVAMYQLLCGVVPFDGRDVNECRNAICRNSVKFPPRVGWGQRSKESRDLLRQLLVKEAKLRPSALDALEHPWIVAHDSGRTTLTKKEKRRSVGGLQAFNDAPSFVKATLLLASVQLSAADLADIERTFAALDLDRDGFITCEELREVLQEPHAPDGGGAAGGVATGGSVSVFSASAFSHLAGPEGSVYIQQIVDNADLNCNGVIDFSEFVAACLHTKLTHSKSGGVPVGAMEILRSAFECFDADCDGLVTEEEILRMVGTPKIKRIEEHAGVDYKDILRGLPSGYSLNFTEFSEVVLGNLADSKYSGGLKMLPDTSSAADVEEFAHGVLGEEESLFCQQQQQKEQQQQQQQQPPQPQQKLPLQQEEEEKEQQQQQQQQQQQKQKTEQAQAQQDSAHCLPPEAAQPTKNPSKANGELCTASPEAPFANPAAVSPVAKTSCCVLQ